MSKIYWLQPEDNLLGKWQRKVADISGSDTF